MWIIKNMLKGALKFPGLDFTIPPGAEFDLDDLPREVTENSNQLMVAFEEGYLKNIRKDPPPQAPGPSEPPSAQTVLTDEALEKALSNFKNKIIEEIKNALPSSLKVTDHSGDMLEKMTRLQESFQGDMGQIKNSMEEIKDKIRQEKFRVLEDQKLSSAELRARLKFLEEQEDEISKNFQRLGTTSTSTEPKGKGLMEKADILSDL